MDDATKELPAENLWPKDPSRNPQESKENVTIDNIKNVIRITDIVEPSFTVFHAKGENKSKPAVVIFPGGAYQLLCYNKEGTEIAEWLNSIGVTAIVVKYTVPDNRNGAFKDAQRAIRLVRSHAEEWDINPDQIGVLGFSAGGHLAARVSTAFETESYEPFDDADKQSCRPDFCVLIYPAYLDNADQTEVTEELPITDKIPPTFIIHTEDDEAFVGGSKLYGPALKKVGVPVEFHLFEKGGHGYGLRPSENEVSNWPELCGKWLAESIINK